jgi:hypothetical protein
LLVAYASSREGTSQERVEPRATGEHSELTGLGVQGYRCGQVDGEAGGRELMPRPEANFHFAARYHARALCATCAV